MTNIDIQGLFFVRRGRFLVKAGKIKVSYTDSEQVFSYLKRLIERKGRVVEGWDKRGEEVGGV